MHDYSALTARLDRAGIHYTIKAGSHFITATTDTGATGRIQWQGDHYYYEIEDRDGNFTASGKTTLVASIIHALEHCPHPAA